MTPEEVARLQIDVQLAASGWAVQSNDRINLSASRGVAACERVQTESRPLKRGLTISFENLLDAVALGTTEVAGVGSFYAHHKSEPHSILRSWEV